MATTTGKRTKEVDLHAVYTARRGVAAGWHSGFARTQLHTLLGAGGRFNAGAEMAQPVVSALHKKEKLSGNRTGRRDVSGRKEGL